MRSSYHGVTFFNINKKRETKKEVLFCPFKIFPSLYILYIRIIIPVHKYQNFKLYIYVPCRFGPLLWKLVPDLSITNTDYIIFLPHCYPNI